MSKQTIHIKNLTELFQIFEKYKDINSVKSQNDRKKNTSSKEFYERYQFQCKSKAENNPNSIEIYYNSTLLMEINELILYFGGKNVNVDLLPTNQIIVDEIETILSEEATKNEEKLKLSQKEYKNLKEEICNKENRNFTDSLAWECPQIVFSFSNKTKLFIIQRLIELIECFIEIRARERLEAYEKDNKTITEEVKTHLTRNDSVRNQKPVTEENISQIISLSSFDVLKSDEISLEDFSEIFQPKSKPEIKICTNSLIDKLKTNLGEICLSLKYDEIENLPIHSLILPYFPVKWFIENINQLQQVNVLIISRILKETIPVGFQMRLRQMRLRQMGQVKNLNIVLLRLFFGMKYECCTEYSKNCPSISIYKELCKTICRDCLVFFLSKDGLSTCFHHFLYSEGHFNELILADIKITRLEQENCTQDNFKQYKFSLSSDEDLVCVFFSILCDDLEISHIELDEQDYLSYYSQRSENSMAKDEKSEKSSIKDAFTVKKLIKAEQNIENFKIFRKEFPKMANVDKIKGLLWLFAEDKVRDFGDCDFEKTLEEENFNKIASVFYKKQAQTFSEIIKTLTLRQFKSILNVNLRLDAIFELKDWNITINSFLEDETVNFSSFYKNICDKIGILENLSEQNKVFFVKHFILDDKFDKTQRLESLPVITNHFTSNRSINFESYFGPNLSFLGKLIKFALQCLKELEFDELHLLIIKDFCDLIQQETNHEKTPLKLKMTAEITKNIDFLTISTKNKAKELAIVFKIRNIKNK